MGRAAAAPAAAQHHGDTLQLPFTRLPWLSRSMELGTPLNKAHFLVREAERLLKKGKFGEAVKLQDKIVTLLEAAKADSRDNKVTDSIELQIKHHIRQKVVITQRQSRCEKYTKDLQNLQLKMAKANLQDTTAEGRWKSSNLEPWPAETCSTGLTTGLWPPPSSCPVGAPRLRLWSIKSSSIR